MPPHNTRHRADEEARMLDSDDDDDHNFTFELRPRKKDSDPATDLRNSEGFRLAIKRRRCLHSRLVKILLLLPVAVLAGFGILHIVRSRLAGDGLFWESPDNSFLPDWGKSGHEGEFVAHYPTDATRDVIPIPCHSHNDYWRRIPFFEAIHYGCTGVEADVWLKHSELYVGHSTASLTRNRTFTAMYVDPLVALLEKQNPRTEFTNTSGHGVFDEVPEQTLVLLIDFKTDGAETWPFVLEQLSPLRERGYLSSWNGSLTTYRAITVVATGNAPLDLLVANETHRDVFYDAPLDRLNATGAGGVVFDTSNSYYSSVSLKETVGDPRHGRFSKSQLEAIRAHVGAAQRAGLKSRFWETPAWPVALRNYVWRTLVDEGVEVLNVDDLKAAARMDWNRHEHGIV